MRKLAAAAAMLLCVPAWGTVYYVSPGGNDSNNGLATGTAFRHMQRAGDLMHAGDTVYVRAGTYTEPTEWDDHRWEGIHAARSGTQANPITFRNYPGETPIVDNNQESTGIGSAGASWIVIDGFKVIHGWSGPGLICPGDDWLVQNCHLSNALAPEAGQHGNGFRIQSSERTTIRNCRIEDCHILVNENLNATAMMFYDSFNIMIENNEITDTRVGIFEKDDGGTNHYRRNYIHDTSRYGWLGPNQHPDLPHNFHVYENVFVNTGGVYSQGCAEGTYWYNNTLYNAGGLYRGSTTDFYMWNNVVVNSHNTAGFNDRLGYFLSINNPTVPDYADYNCVYPVFRTVVGVYVGDVTYTSYSAWRAAYPALDAHTFVADPQFVSGSPSDPADFHLQSGSPCENAGIRYWNDETVDRDLGAYPFGNTTVVGLLPSGAPTISIETPSDTGTYATTNSTVDLAGTANDNVAVTSVTWVNQTTGASGSATGTDAWSVSGIALQEGANNIVVTAHDGDANAGTDAITVTYTIPGANVPPVADAGTDAISGIAVAVQLDGNASYDPGGTITSYSWEQLTGPGITLSGASAPIATFTPTVEGDYTFRLTVSDGEATDTDDVAIQIAEPWADAGDDMTRVVGNTVTLSGDGGAGNPSATLAYAWTQVSGTSVTLSGASTLTASFTASDAGTLVFRLTVEIVGGNSDTDEVTVLVEPANVNVAPVADAGDDERVAIGEYARLDAAASFDPNDGDTLTYLWEQLSGPAASIDNPDSTVAFFAAPEAGDYTLRVTVSDGELTATDSVLITATNAAGTTTEPVAPTDIEVFEVWPNAVATADAGSISIVGPSALQGVAAQLFSVSGETIGEITLLEAGYAAIGKPGEGFALDVGVYLVVAGADGIIYRARFVVEP